MIKMGGESPEPSKALSLAESVRRLIQKGSGTLKAEANRDSQRIGKS